MIRLKPDMLVVCPMCIDGAKNEILKIGRKVLRVLPRVLVYLIS